MSVKQEHHFIGVTSILVVSLGFAAWLSLTNPLDSEGISTNMDNGLASKVANSETKTGIAGRAVPSSEGSRFPASLPLVKPRALVEVFCNRKGQRIETSEAQVRLKLVGCQGSQKKQLAVKNLTNGFTASVFKDKETLSTDYIDVVKGENSLRIEILESKTSVTETDFAVFSQKN